MVGLEKVSETDDTSGYVHVEAHYDRDAVLDLVSAEDIVESVEEQVLNRTEGDVGNTSATRMAINVSRRGTSDDSRWRGQVRRPRTPR